VCGTDYRNGPKRNAKKRSIGAVRKEGMSSEKILLAILSDAHYELIFLLACSASIEK
jgi:hypothetical protein